MAAPQSGRHVELSASLASQLPQVPRNHTTPPFVGVGLARDGCTAVRQVCRVVCIAGEPAATDTGEPHHSTLCGSRACPRWLRRGPAGMSSCLHRWQASSYRYRGATPLHPLWESGLPAMAAPRSGRCVELSASLASQLPQVPGNHTIPPFVGVGLARDGCTAVRQVCRVVCIAGEPAPTDSGEPHLRHPPQLIQSGGVALTHQLPAHAPGWIHRHAGSP